MPQRLSNLNESQLRYLLFRIKEIASITDDSALAEADKLLHEFQKLMVVDDSEDGDFDELDYDESGYASAHAAETLRDFQEKLADIENRITQNIKISPCKYQRLPNQAESLGQYWPKKFCDERTEDIAKLKSEALRLANLGESTLRSQIVNEMLEFPLNNVASVQKVVRELKEAYSYFVENHSLTDELRTKIENGKTRAAWYRAKKKLAEAEVAEAIDSLIRTKKLKKEAEILLAQDWEMIFPGVTPPSI